MDCAPDFMALLCSLNSNSSLHEFVVGNGKVAMCTCKQYPLQETLMFGVSLCRVPGYTRTSCT